MESVIACTHGHNPGHTSGISAIEDWGSRSSKRTRGKKKKREIEKKTRVKTNRSKPKQTQQHK
jgi:hypothetical protein